MKKPPYLHQVLVDKMKYNNLFASKIYTKIINTLFLYIKKKVTR
jgi:hypothetical protein